jgi:hypothetical protein
MGRAPSVTGIDRLAPVVIRSERFVACTWRLRPTVLRAAWWALRSTWRVRRQLRAGVSRPTVAAPPDLPTCAALGVDAVLGHLEATCLEGALVRQRWLAAHGVVRDIVIGLPVAGFGPTPAHAWVDGTDQAAEAEHLELHRLPAPT